MNLAARLLGRAEAGEAVATTRVLADAGPVFDAAPLPSFTVKGKRAPVEAAIIRGERQEAAEVRIPFLGREAELTEMAAALAGASAGRGTVLDVVGEPGIGKSRLVAELSTPAAMRRSPSRSAITTAAPRTPRSGCCCARFSASVCMSSPRLPRPCWPRVRQVAPDLLPSLPLLGVPLGLDMPATREVDDLDTVSAAVGSKRPRSRCWPLASPHRSWW